MERYRRILNWPTVVVASIAVMILMLAAAYLCERHADAARHMEMLLAAARQEADHVHGLGIDALGRATVSPSVRARVRDGSARTIDVLAQAAREDPDEPLLKVSHRLARRYEAALREELVLVAAGEAARARRADRLKTEPAFTALNESLGQAAAFYARVRAERARDRNLIVMLGALGSVVVVLWLFRRFERAELVAERAVADREAVQREERRFKSLVHNSSDVIMILNPEGMIQYASASAKAVFGHDSDEMISRDLLEWIAADDWWLVHEWIGRCAAGSTASVEFRFAHTDGCSRQIEATGSPRLDDPQVRGIVVNAHDVTERVRTRAALAESEERYRRLVDAAPDGIGMLVEGRIVYANDELAHILGAPSPADLVGTYIASFVPSGQREAARQVLQCGDTPSATGRLVSELELRRMDGSRAPVELSRLTTMYKGQNAIQVIVRDITARREIDRLKSDFVAMVSHELRSPLSVIVGNAIVVEKLLSETKVARSIVKAVRRIQERGHLMTQLIESLLDLSQMEAGMFKLTREDMNMRELVAGVAEAAATSNGLKLLFDVDEELPTVWADRTRLATALSNLVANAVKFSPDGGEILLGAHANNGHVRLSVSDHGIGIRPEDRDLIFERFVQGDMSSTRNFSGAGLGLYVTRRIIDAHGGTVTVDSEPGEGSTFTIEIPVRGDQEGPAAGESADSAIRASHPQG